MTVPLDDHVKVILENELERLLDELELNRRSLVRLEGQLAETRASIERDETALAQVEQALA